MNYAIRLASVWDGPRHSVLRRVWSTVAQSAPVRFFQNEKVPHLSHAKCFEAMWSKAQHSRERFVVLTEMDFLPNLWDADWAKIGELGGHFAGWGVRYCTRDLATRQENFDDERTGGWFLVLDKKKVPRNLSFHGDPDPCNQIHEVVQPFFHWRGADCYPRHYGVEYPMGTHLFWSRHYNDPPELRVAGFSLRDVHRGVDEEIARWLMNAPPQFKQTFARLYGSGVLESCCGSTAGTSTSAKSSPKSGK